MPFDFVLAVKITQAFVTSRIGPQTSTAVTIASAGIVAANALGLLPNSFGTDGSSAPAASIATQQETLVEKASSNEELASAPRQENEEDFANGDAVAEEKAPPVTEKEDEQAEKTTGNVPEMVDAEQMPSASSEETKPHSNFFGLPTFLSPESKAKEPVAEENVEEIIASDTLETSAKDATASTGESTTAVEEKATSADVPAASIESEPTTAEEAKAPAAVEEAPAVSAEPTTANEEKASTADVKASSASADSESTSPDVEEQKPSVDAASTPPASENQKSESVFDDLMKKMEMAGKGQVVDDASTPSASETPNSESVFDDLMKKMEIAGKAGMDGVETAKEKPVDKIGSAKPIQSVEEVAKPEETSAEIAPPIARSSDGVFDDLMKRMEQAGKAGAESVEAAKEKVAEAIEDVVDALSGEGEAVEDAVAESVDATEAAGVAAASSLKLQVRIPELTYKNIDPIAVQGAAVLTFGAIAAAALIGASNTGGNGSTFAPGTKSKGTGYLDGLTRSSASLASKGTKGPTSYLDKLKTPSSAMSSARTGAGAGASYLDAISPKSAATKKSYSFSGKKPIKTGSSDSPVKTLAPSGSYKAAPASPSVSQPPQPKSPSPTFSPEKIAEPPALSPLYASSQLSGSSSGPQKSFNPYGNTSQSTVGAGSMGSSSSYLSNMSSSGATFVSPSVVPTSQPPAPSPLPVTAATATTATTSQAAPKASYSPFGNKPKITDTTGAMGSSSSYLSGTNAANGAGASYSFGPSFPPPSSPPGSYMDNSQATPKTSYSPFSGGTPKSTGNAGAMGSSSSYLTGMGASGTNGDWQSQPPNSPPPASEPVTASPSKSYAPMKGKPKAVARSGPGSYLDAL